MRTRKPRAVPETPYSHERIIESLAERGIDSDEETGIEMNADELREMISRDVPRHRLVECIECEEHIDRDVTPCPFCGSHNKESLFRFTDAGNAERLAFLHGDRLRYCAALGGWLTYDGRRWRLDATGEVERLALSAIRTLYGEVGCVEDDDQILQHVRRSESARGVLACVRLAQSQREIAARPEDFDADQWVLNVQNGTLDLRSGVLRPHDPRDLLSKIAAAPYEPGAKSPLWERVLSEALGGDREKIAYVKRSVGYCLTGCTSEEKLLVVQGPAGSSKSTIIESSKRMLGDYGMTADFETFVTKTSGGPRNDVARLVSARMVTAGEVDHGRRLAEGLVKSLTGGDEVTARFLFREAFTFTPQFKLVLVCNDLPAARDDDSGLWRRIVRVPFDHVVPEAERDPQVKATLCDPAQSGAAILAWAVEGCLEWQRVGLAPPAAITRATSEYRTSQDPLADFIKDECLVDRSAHVRRATLRAAYEEWSRENDGKPIGAREMAERLRALGMLETKHRGERGWRGIGIREDVEEERPDEEQHTANGNGVGHVGALGHQDPDPSHTRARVGGGSKSDAPKCPSAPRERGRRFHA